MFELRWTVFIRLRAGYCAAIKKKSCTARTIEWMEKNKKTNVTFKQHVQQHWEKNRYVGVILV